LRRAWNTRRNRLPEQAERRSSSRLIEVFVMGTRLWFVGLVVIASLARLDVGAAAELAPAQRDKLVWIDQQLQKCVTLYRDKKTDDLKKLIGEIETALTALQVDTAEPVLNPYRARLAAAQKLSTFVPPAVAAAANRPVPTKKPAPGTPPAPGAGGVSFIKDVVPILVGKCNNCHVTGNRGDFSMANYGALMAGTAGQYAVIKPGKGDTSTLVEKMASGEMPPNGNKVSDTELQTIIKWINEGAKFDGPDMTVALGSLAPTGTAGAGNGPPQVVRASGNEKVHFMRDVAPILINNCMDCHGAQGNNAASNYSMYSFNGLIRGGQNNNRAITPGNAEESFMVKMLRGTAKGPDGTTTLRRMPARRDALEDKDLQTIITWIQEGAKFDGESPTESLQLLFDIEQAKKATHEELLASRLARGKSSWSRANPDAQYEVIEVDDFAIFGNLGSVRLQEFAKQVQDEKAKLVTSLKIPTGQPLVKGRISILVFDKKFEYGEYGRVAEGRELSTDMTAHWKFNWIDAYGCVVAQATPEETAPLISQVICGVYLDSLGSYAPRWFAVGTARNVAGKIHAKSVTAKVWQDALAPAMSSNLSPDAVLATNNPDGTAAALSQGFVAQLMKTPAWTVLMSSIAKGNRFDGAFQSAYRSQPNPLFKQWLGR
jgi:hypothetical protein